EDRVRGAGTAAETGPGHPGRPGDGRPQVSGQGTRRAVRERRGVGGRPAAVPGERAGPGEAAGVHGPGPEVVAATPGPACGRSCRWGGRPRCRGRPRLVSGGEGSRLAGGCEEGPG